MFRRIGFSGSQRTSARRQRGLVRNRVAHQPSAKEVGGYRLGEVEALNDPGDLSPALLNRMSA